MSFDVRRWDGGKIATPGVYENISMDGYHGDLCAGPSISSSGLRTIFHQSPRHYWRTSYLNPKRVPETPSKAFLFGRAAHHLLLGEANFFQSFVIRPDTYPPEDRPWNANSNWCKAWLADHADKIVLTGNDILMVRAMAEALAEEPLIQAGVLNGLMEHSFVWRDEESGVWLKWRPDGLPTDSLAFADLKTTTAVDDLSIERTIGAYGYNMQGALGQLACQAVLGRDMESFTLVFVEKDAAYPCVRVKTIRDPDIALGVRQLRAALKLFRKSLDEGRWLGPGGEQHDNEYAGLTDRDFKWAEARVAEIERLAA